MDKKKKVVCDIDGVLATGTTDEVYSDEAGWAYEKCRPILQGIELLRIIKETHGCYITLNTARPHCDREKTVRWLRRNAVPYDRLCMGKPSGIYLDDRSFPEPFLPATFSTQEQIEQVAAAINTAAERTHQ